MDTFAPRAAGSCWTSCWTRCTQAAGRSFQAGGRCCCLGRGCGCYRPITAAAGSSTGPLTIDLDMVGVYEAAFGTMQAQLAAQVGAAVLPDTMRSSRTRVVFVHWTSAPASLPPWAA